MIQKKRAKAAAATANRPAGGNYSRLALAIHRVYSDSAGAKSPVGFGDSETKRRTSANITAGAFFMSACFMADCVGRPQGLLVPFLASSPTPHNPSPVLWRGLLAVPTQKGAVHHEHHHPHQLQRWTPTRTPRPSLLLARVIHRKAPEPSHSGRKPYRGRAHLQPLLPGSSSRKQWPLCDLNAANQLFEVTP